MTVNFKRVIIFLNSNLGIWLLTTIAAGGIAFLYSNLEAAWKAKEKRLAAYESTSTETLLRLVQWQKYFKGNKDDCTDLANYYEILLIPPKQARAQGVKIYPLHPEFDERAMLSILYEAYLNSETSEKRKIERVSQYIVEWNTEEMSKLSFQECVSKLGSAWGPEFEIP